MVAIQLRTRDALLRRLYVLGSMWTDTFYGNIFSADQMLHVAQTTVRKVWL